MISYIPDHKMAYIPPSYPLIQECRVQSDYASFKGNHYIQVLTDAIR